MLLIFQERLCVQWEDLKKIEGKFPLSKNRFRTTTKGFPRKADMWMDKLNANAIEYSVAARGGFLNLIKVLRLTVLQDAVVIMGLFPQHPVFKNAISTDSPFSLFFKVSLF